MLTYELDYELKLNIKKTLERNDTQEFLKLYQTSTKDDRHLFGSEIILLRPSVAMPYIDIVLDKSPDYNFSLISYLIEHGYNQKVVEFFKSLDSNINYIDKAPDRGLRICEKNASEFLKTLQTYQDTAVFSFLMTKLPLELREDVFKSCVKTNYQFGVDSLLSGVKEPHLYFIDDIIYKISRSSRSEVNWDFYFNYLEVDQPEELKKAIIAYALTQYEVNPNKVMMAEIPRETASVMLNSTIGIMIPRENPPIKAAVLNFPAMNSKATYYNTPAPSSQTLFPNIYTQAKFAAIRRKVAHLYHFNYADHQKDTIAQSIWLKFNLEKELPAHIEGAQKVNKI